LNVRRCHRGARRGPGNRRRGWGDRNLLRAHTGSCE